MAQSNTLDRRMGRRIRIFVYIRISYSYGGMGQSNTLDRRIGRRILAKYFRLTRPRQRGGGFIAPYGDVTGPPLRCSSVCVKVC